MEGCESLQCGSRLRFGVVAIGALATALLAANPISILCVVAIMAVVTAILLALPDIRAWLDPDVREYRRSEKEGKEETRKLAVEHRRTIRHMLPWSSLRRYANRGIIIGTLGGNTSKWLRMRRVNEWLASTNVVPFWFLAWLYKRPGCKGIAEWLANNWRLMPGFLFKRIDKWLIAKGSWSREIGRRD